MTTAQTATAASKNDRAAEALAAHTASAWEALARIQALLEDHFGATPDEVNWTHVGEAASVANLLNEIVNQHAL